MPTSSSEPDDTAITAQAAAVPPTPRRKRFERADKAAHPLTPLKLEVLRLVVESKFLATPQVAGLMGLSEHAARQHLRDLFDMGLTDVVAVPGIALGQKALIAAKVHYPTKQGLSELERLGMLPQEAEKPAAYSPRHYSRLAHELTVRDFLVWLSVSARNHGGHMVRHWDCSAGLQAVGTVPDAVFVYDLGGRGIAGILEADMGTERGTAGDRFDRWAQKLAGYGALFGPDGEEQLRLLTGSPRARLVVTVPDALRADWILRRVGSVETVARVTWVAVRSELAGADATAAAWRRPDGSVQPFVPPSVR